MSDKPPTVAFPTGPEDVDTIRLTWMPEGQVEWCRGGESRPFPPGSTWVRVAYWLADRPFDAPVNIEHPDMWSDLFGGPGMSVSSEPRAKIVFGNA